MQGIRTARGSQAALIAGVAAGLVSLAGCGGGTEPAASGSPMGSTAEARDAVEPGVNHPPEIHAVRLEPDPPAPGQTVRALVEASDPDGDPVQLAYTWRIGPRPGGSSGVELPLDGAVKGDVVSLTVTAGDGSAEGAPVSARVRVGNRAPLLHSVVLEPMGEVTAGQDLRARPRAVDPDGDELEYRFRWWVNGREQDVSGDTLAAGSFTRGDEIEVEVVADDGDERSQRIRSAAIRVGNGAPRIVSQPEAVDAEGRFRYQLRAEDPDGDTRLRFALVEGPPGLRVDPVLGLVQWQPAEDVSGRFPVVVSVDDLQGGEGTQRFELVVGDAPPAAAAPSP